MPTMVLIPCAIVLTSLLSVRAQNTPSPTITPAPAATTTPAIGPAPLPLTEYHFQYPNLPYQVNPYPVLRGPQSGYNICNSTTEGPTSQCQTMFVNSIEDFCIWGSPQPNGVIGNLEAVVVAFCTKPGRGTRLIPPGTLTAVQFIKTPGYIQLTGLINQAGINLDPTDAGGELDPHGADLAGNPLGGLVFSNNLPASPGQIVQVNNWNNFLGGGIFCIKACDPTINSPNYCENRFDTQGCAFNMPASYAPNEFTSCLGDPQLPPGAAPVIPASSSCTTYTSSLLYPNTATSSTAATTTGTAKPSSTSRAASTTTSSSGAIGVVPPFAQSSGVFFAAAIGIVTAFAGVIAML